MLGHIFDGFPEVVHDGLGVFLVSPQLLQLRLLIVDIQLAPEGAGRPVAIESLEIYALIRIVRVHCVVVAVHRLLLKALHLVVLARRVRCSVSLRYLEVRVYVRELRESSAHEMLRLGCTLLQKLRPGLLAHGFNFFQKLRMAQLGIVVLMPSPLASVRVDSPPLCPVQGSLEGLVNLQEPLLRPEFVGELREPSSVQFPLALLEILF